MIFLVALGVILAGASMSSSAEPDGLQPLDERQWDLAKARHLLSRAGFGGTPEEVAKLYELGPRQAVDFVVDFSRQPELEIPPPVERPPPVRRTRIADDKIDNLAPAERAKRLRELRMLPDQPDEDRQFAALREWWLRRMVTSPRPLEEKLVLFWHGHFATDYRVVRSAYAMYVQNELFRKHAAGSFAHLLHGVVHDAAMLRYLDSDKNIKKQPNENLAREIMELFSLGVGNFTERDIAEAARTLTGYNFDLRSSRFTFRASLHDDGVKTILGKTGNWSGDDLVDLILAQPPTARFIARKLYVFFSHDDPSPRLVEQLAAVLRDNDYEVAPMLKVLFLSQEFYGARAMGTQIKSPIQLVVGALRSLNIQPTSYDALLAATQEMGQDLFQPPSVKGWDGGRAWINTNTLFARQNFAASLVVPGQEPVGEDRQAVVGDRSRSLASMDLVRMVGDRELRTSAEVVDFFVSACLAIPIGGSKRQQLIELLDRDGPLPLPLEWRGHEQTVGDKLRDLLVTIMGLPEFQLT